MPCIPCFHFYGKDLAELEKYKFLKEPAGSHMVFLPKQVDLWRKLMSMKEYQRARYSFYQVRFLTEYLDTEYLGFLKHVGVDLSHSNPHDNTYEDIRRNRLLQLLQP